MSVYALEIAGPIGHPKGNKMQVVFERESKLYRITVNLYANPIYPNQKQIKSEDLDPSQLIFGEMCYERIMVNGGWVHDSNFQKQTLLEYPSRTWLTKPDQLKGRPSKKGIYVTYLMENGKKYPQIYIVFKDNDLRGSALYTLCPELFQEVHSGAAYPD